MANVSFAYRPSVDLSVTGLHGLRASTTFVSGWGSQEISNTGNTIDFLVGQRFVCGTGIGGAGFGNGQIRTYVVPPINDTTYVVPFTGGTFDNQYAFVDTELRDSAGRILSVVEVDTWSSSIQDIYYVSPASVAALFGGMLPEKFQLFVTNNCTGAGSLALTGNLISIKSVYATVI